MLPIHLQIGGQKALITANPRNDAEDVADPHVGTDFSWSEDFGGIVAQLRLNSGQQCKYTAIAPGTVTATVSGLSANGVTVTYPFTIIVDPPPVNELTHFSPTVEFVD